MSCKKKVGIWLIISAAILAVVVGAVLVVGVLLPYLSAKNTMDPNGVLTLYTENDGRLRVQWEEGTNAQTYSVQVKNREGKLIHAVSTGENSCILTSLPQDEEVTVRVESSHNYGKRVRAGDEALEVTLKLASPKISDLQWKADVGGAKVDATFNMDQGDVCRVYMTTDEGKPVLVEEVTEGQVSLPFGEGKKYAIPEHGVKLHFAFELERKSGQISYRGDTLEGFTVTREDLLGAVLNVQIEDLGENRYTITWNETKGEYYEVRFSTDGENWEKVATIQNGEELSYTTEQLVSFTDYQVWVVSLGGQTLPNSEYAADSKPVEISTGARLLNTTIWPLMDQKVYADKECTEELGTAVAGSAWCVLGLEDQLLKIRFAGQEGYIDSTFCMINLTEYVGNLCLYDITNSYRSIYTVHEFGINRVSGTVITGYEDVKVGDGEYLVPLLFPTAQKLIKAGQSAKEQGYTLKIYDSFRPKNATDRIYALTSIILDDPVPTQTFTGRRVTDLDKLDWEYQEEEEEEENTTPPEENKPEENTPTETTTTTPPTEEESSEAPEQKRRGVTKEQGEEEEEEEPWYGIMRGLTYRILMCNDDKYSLSAFLAPGSSRHNFGVALDLTLVDKDGKEMAMQTSIHDLSWYSASKRNNGNAATLYRIMTGAGFKDLYSEWWHFQDNEIYEANKLEPLKTGVSQERWVYEEEGWRYRLADGTYCISCTRAIEGKSYTFDENGFVAE